MALEALDARVDAAIAELRTIIRRRLATSAQSDGRVCPRP